MTDKLTFSNGQTGSRYDHRRFLEIETGRCAHRAEDQDPAVRRLARRRASIVEIDPDPRAPEIVFVIVSQEHGSIGV